MEIERKFTLKSLPDNLESYPSHHIEQVYLNDNPVVRARKQDDEYYLTYKGSGMMARDESNLPLNEVSYYHLREKADGSVISKRRYLIPLQHPGFKEGFPTPPADYFERIPVGGKAPELIDQLQRELYNEFFNFCHVSGA